MRSSDEKAPRRCAQTDSTVSPPTSIALAMGHLAFGRVTMHVLTCGIRWRAAAVAAAAQPRQLGRHRDPVLHRLAPFLAHRVGSRKSRWASSPTSEVTALPSPAVASVSVLLLLLVSVGVWLLIPVLMMRAPAFGCYLAWAFSAPLGITELAHFVVLLVPRPTGLQLRSRNVGGPPACPGGAAGHVALVRGTHDLSIAGHIAGG